MPTRPASRPLRLRFESPERFLEAYRRDLSRGGAFVPGAAHHELREPVSVVLELAWRGEQVELEAEVVHVVPPGLARAGGTAGVAVQFQRPAPELRELLAPFAQEARASAKVGAPAAAGLELVTPGEVRLAPAGLEEGSAAGGFEIEDFDPGLRAVEAPPASRPEGAVRARRRITRVHVRLERDGRVLEGRTRDISESGVLVSVDGSELPVGARLALALRDPLSGAALQVGGVVARRVHAEGTVAALGIRFELDPGRGEEVAEFVDRLWRTDRNRRLGGIRGEIAEVDLGGLLQMLAQSAPQGTLGVARAGEEGVVAFEGRRLRYARLGGLRGARALARLLAWREGRFEFHAHVDPLEAEDPPEPLEAVLLEAARHLDEAAREDPGALDPEARLRLVPGRAIPIGLGRTELAVLELARAGLGLRRVLDVIPEPDERVLAAVRALRERGLVTLG
jgi:Tfp pilus assembly protein PilZ